MVCTHHHLMFAHTFAIPFLILLISTTSHVRLLNVEGRKLAQIPYNSETVEEEKAMWRAQIGSRPPRCERRCEAIQVPTNPQVSGNGTAVEVAMADVRGEGSSNYKPMSWKCKCGNLIVNP